MKLLRCVLSAALLIVVPYSAYGQDGSATQTQQKAEEQDAKQAEADAEAVRKEVEDAAQAIGDYTLNRRDEALRKH